MGVLRCGLAMVLGVSAAVAQAEPALTIDGQSPYQGLFFHEFTGSVDGSEWSTWGPIAGEGRLEFSDLTAGGTYPATVAPDGSFTLDNGAGTGAFTDEHGAFIHFSLPGGLAFESVIRRAPYTDRFFPVFAAPPVPGDTSLTGLWRARVLDVDPSTGETLHEHTRAVRVDVAGTTVRVTDEDGSFVQGVWRSDEQAGFRVIHPTPRLPRYRTFAGSALSASTNMVGDLRVLSDHQMTLAVFFQSRAPLGEQEQTMRYYELTRVPAPWAPVPIASACLLGARRRR